MRIWFACFLLLFVLAELFDWVKDFTLPLPIYILGGAFLAVVSNYDKLVGSYLHDSSNLIRDVIRDTIPEQVQLDSSFSTHQQATLSTSSTPESTLPQVNHQINQ
ncbi:hypothetical protein [Calothrix sp. UHCC 0171]|uniref:hypothetical protein n=1 Tax=Calothrix sp. UHCC 0171 TaxID=3110245 RepID=UPI002B21E85D|nr:hypothetical protein [Calothrix sp. UHCC 0171]MEA5571621.1 hypothetical protein [Calothrix sp. UHCC 0171]